MAAAGIEFDGHGVPPEESGKWLSLIFTVFMHGLLAVLLFYSVQWQRRPAEAVQVELVRSLPDPVVQAPPPPPPAPEPVRVQPPEPVKPDIVLEKKPLPKKEPPKKEPPKPEPKPETKPAAPAPLDDRLQRMLALDANKAKLDSQQRTAVENKVKADAQATALNQDRAKWVDLISQKIKSKLEGVIPPEVKGKPVAEVSLELLPDRTIREGSVRLTRSTGNALLDKMVVDAINKASPLPPPPNAEAFERNLKFIFRPLGE